MILRRERYDPPPAPAAAVACQRGYHGKAHS
jgi:hypothetical protein